LPQDGEAGLRRSTRSKEEALSDLMFFRVGDRHRVRALAAAVFAVAALGLLALPGGAHAKSRGTKVKVMTRNLFLGADLTPGVEASNLQQLVDAAGQILNQVDVNNFHVRSKGLAAEIRKKNPDLVGLQEAALWRDEPCTETPLPPHATHVRHGNDFIKLLLNKLNRGQKRYRLVISEPEFDFEVWANTDGNESTSAPMCPYGSEINGRLTMRDAILARVGGNVETRKPKGGHYETLLQESPGGVPTNVTRGWARVNARVNGSPWFRFVDTHLESFDDQAANHTNQSTDLGKGEVREAQARELFAQGGPASGRLPVVLVGDLNSDDDTVQDGDRLAYDALIGGGFRERSTDNPLGCCLKTSTLTLGGGGSVSDFDHQVDHILTDSPRKVKLVNSSVTGRHPVNGFWDSDHAGLFSALTVR
jgi:endonuclease/exonuclease/phosphatase family metal-dependent hydrolase